MMVSEPPGPMSSQKRHERKGPGLSLTALSASVLTMAPSTRLCDDKGTRLLTCDRAWLRFND